MENAPTREELELEIARLDLALKEMGQENVDLQRTMTAWARQNDILREENLALREEIRQLQAVLGGDEVEA